MNDKKAILCPACSRLIGGDLESCPYCGFNNPGNLARVLAKTRRLSFVKSIIIVNAVYFILSFVFTFLLGEGFGSGLVGLPAPGSLSLALLGWARQADIQSGILWPLITATFLHGGLLHIFFNMMWVRDLGTLTERVFSPSKMLIIYLVSGICGNTVAVTVVPNPVIGASGAVFGLMGALVAFGRKSRSSQGRYLSRQIATWAVVMIMLGFIMTNVSNSAHIGGFITGLILGFLLPTEDSIFKARFYNWAAFSLIGLCIWAFGMVAFRFLIILPQIS